MGYNRKNTLTFRYWHSKTDLQLQSASQKIFLEKFLNWHENSISNVGKLDPEPFVKQNMARDRKEMQWRVCVENSVGSHAGSAYVLGARASS